MNAVVLALILIALSPGTAWAAADDLSTARELYASAAYEEALVALNRARANGVPPADAFAVEQYRAFCLLALGRGTEAQSAIENLVTAEPLYFPSPTEVSPRVRSAFSEVRRRLLPSLIPQQYAKAKTAFDKKDYATAAAGFTKVLTALNDPDVAHAASQPPLSDLRTLAVGFQELSAKAVVPPPLPASPPPAPVVAAAPAPAASPRPAPAPAAPARVYTTVDTAVVPPATVRQDLPPFSGRTFEEIVGALEVIIDERGFVESATMRESVTAQYDRQAVDATRNWRYRSALLNGVPVKYRKLIQIAIKPTN